MILWELPETCVICQNVPSKTFQYVYCPGHIFLVFKPESKTGVISKDILTNKSLPIITYKFSMTSYTLYIGNEFFMYEEISPMCIRTKDCFLDITKIPKSVEDFQSLIEEAILFQ